MNRATGAGEKRQADAAPAAARSGCCGECAAFEGQPARTDDERERLARAGIDPSAGVCHLNPIAVAKKSNDWCAQYRPAREAHA